MLVIIFGNGRKFNTRTLEMLFFDIERPMISFIQISESPANTQFYDTNNEISSFEIRVVRGSEHINISIMH